MKLPLPIGCVMFPVYFVWCSRKQEHTVSLEFMKLIIHVLPPTE